MDELYSDLAKVFERAFIRNLQGENLHESQVIERLANDVADVLVNWDDNLTYMEFLNRCGIAYDE